ncbi:hypothetical protein [Ramlibacter rhizophilus]|uniref:hypothetical protein n=1 Tax=Ramlibacter rhizophilus TaxID=1781167 RepID=UPI0014326527|nr:hypothetical protein [Ramlibacter rhizophilus]
MLFALLIAPARGLQWLLQRLPGPLRAAMDGWSRRRAQQRWARRQQRMRQRS